MNREQRQKLRQQVEANRNGAMRVEPPPAAEVVAAAPVAAPAVAPERPKPPKPVQGPPAVVTFQCGHTKPLAHFKSGACAECRDAGRKAKAARHREKQQGKRPDGKPKLDDSGRLPGGSRFDVVYDAHLQRWHGSLTCFLGTEDAVMYQGAAGGVEGLLRSLAANLRKHLAERAANNTENQP